MFWGPFLIPELRLKPIGVHASREWTCGPVSCSPTSVYPVRSCVSGLDEQSQNLLVIREQMASNSSSQTNPRPDHHVVVMSLDGIPAYLWRQPDLAVPNLRRLMAEGSTADAMTETSPANTWSSHTSMITGRSPRAHGVLFLGELRLSGPDLPPKVHQWADKEAYVRAPTLYDVAYDAGLTTAESDWVAITRAPKITWAFPEIPSVEGPVESH